MRTVKPQAVATLLIAATLSAITPARAIQPQLTAKDILGVANWNAAYNPADSNLLKGAIDSQALGVQNIMLAMGPNYDTLDYRNLGISGATSLKDLASKKICKRGKCSDGPFAQVFKMPFTTYGVDLSPLSVPDPLDPRDAAGNPISAEEEQKIVYKEFYNFYTYMYATYQGTGKKFYFKTWEGDNGFHYESLSPTKRPLQTQKDNLIAELQARHDALVQARAEAQKAGITGVTINDAIEFNTIDCQRQGKDPCMLTDIIPKVDSDMLSYSSYETLNKGDPKEGEIDLKKEANTITSDIDYIRNLPGINGRPLIIGEFGFSQDYSGAQGAADLTETAVNAFLKAGIPLAFDWEIKDSGGIDSSLGLINADGSHSEMWKRINAMVEAPAGFTNKPKRPLKTRPISDPRLEPRVTAMPGGGAVSAKPLQYVPLSASTLDAANLPANATRDNLLNAVMRAGPHAVKNVSLDN